MRKVLGAVMVSGLLLTICSQSHAQVNLQFGRGGRPSVSFGQPAYGQYPYYQGQPAYGQTYAQQSYYPQASYAPQYAPSYYSSGYYGYSAPATGYTQSYYQSGYAPGYQTAYPQPSAYPYGYAPYSQPASGTGLMINGRMFMLPR